MASARRPAPRSFTPSAVRVRSGVAGLGVLVVEDDDDLAAYLVDLLEDVGHEATRVATAEAALDKLVAAEFDVVLTDVRLGGPMTGVGLAERMRRDARPEVVIVMTAFGSPDVVESALTAGAVACLSKPFRSAELLGCIELGVLRAAQNAAP
jgi:CheY-like chemotaxis protein